MTAQNNGSDVPAFDSYEAIQAYVHALQEAGVSPDSIIILTPPPPPH